MTIYHFFVYKNLDWSGEVIIEIRRYERKVKKGSINSSRTLPTTGTLLTVLLTYCYMGSMRFEYVRCFRNWTNAASTHPGMSACLYSCKTRRIPGRRLASPREQPHVFEGEVVERLDHLSIDNRVTSVKCSKFRFESSCVVIDEFKMSKIIVIHLWQKMQEESGIIRIFLWLWIWRD